MKALRTNSGRLVVVEDCLPAGSAGQQLSAALEAAQVPAQVRLLNTGDRFIPHGTIAQLRRSLGIDAQGIYETVCEVCHGQN